jgi:hypothetical protein
MTNICFEEPESVLPSNDWNESIDDKNLRLPANCVLPEVSVEFFQIRHEKIMPA